MVEATEEEVYERGVVLLAPSEEGIRYLGLTAREWLEHRGLAQKRYRNKGYGRATYIPAGPGGAKCWEYLQLVKSYETARNLPDSYSFPFRCIVCGSDNVSEFVCWYLPLDVQQINRPTSSNYTAVGPFYRRNYHGFEALNDLEEIAHCASNDYLWGCQFIEEYWKVARELRLI